jgi:hypothetical membrane protein
MYPGDYGPLTNWLSDLGNPQSNPTGAVFYNAGCILTSLLLVIFYIGLRRWNTGDRKMKILLTTAVAAGLPSSLSLILAATFPLGSHTEMHSFWSKMVSVFLGFFLTEHVITLELIRAMAGKKPERVVRLDEGFAGNDQLKANAVQIFKTKGITSFKTV